MLPLDAAHPNTAPAPTSLGTVSSTVSTVFRFNIPSADAAQSCSLVLLLPSRLHDSAPALNMTGTGDLAIARLGGRVDEKTTPETLAAGVWSYRELTVQPDGAYTVDTFACSGGDAVAVELAGVVGGDTQISFVQDSTEGECPIGLYLLTFDGADF
ncbi:ubiquitin 3 binding protein But2 [Rostrohypoxylon terebratum]|nr:ubiquitin 3 binding protein But2 [Rostrohypoxylon terebratum]